MNEVLLQDLLEAGCHFGHKADRWHPKAHTFIYAEKDGVHIIDLAKTKEGLEAAAAFVKELVAEGKEVLFVGTKRQAKGVVEEVAAGAGAPYLAQRWIGGFLTNWDSVSANIRKINRLTEEEAAGGWKKMPKHEQAKLSRYLRRLKQTYAGVLALKEAPQAVFVIDVRKEDSVVREAQRCGLPVVAIVDTNSNPSDINYVIPANDDAVGSIKFITEYLGAAYAEGKTVYQKDMEKRAAEEEKRKAAEEAKRVKEAAEAEKKKAEAEAKPKAPAKKPVEPAKDTKPSKKKEAAT